MNKKYQYLIRMIGSGLLLGTISSSWAAAPSANTCSNLLNIQQPASYQTCKANGAAIQQCIQNNMASQTPNSSASIATQLQASSSASQTLAQLDFQCQYLLAYGSQPFSSSAPSNGGLGSSFKKMLGLQPQSSTPQSSSSNGVAASNQANQLKNIQPKPTKPSPSKEGSQEQNNHSNSINWF